MKSAAIPYITARRNGAVVGTISFEPGDAGVSRFIASTADGKLAARITDTGPSFQVKVTNKTTTCLHWQAAAEEAFGHGITLEHA